MSGNLYGRCWVGRFILKDNALGCDNIIVEYHHCLERNVCRADNKLYRQALGIALGNHYAPPTTILFMDKFERNALEHLVTSTVMRGLGLRANSL